MSCRRASRGWIDGWTEGVDGRRWHRSTEREHTTRSIPRGEREGERERDRERERERERERDMDMDMTNPHLLPFAGGLICAYMSRDGREKTAG